MYCIYNFRKLFDILLRSKLNRIFFMGRRKEKKKRKRKPYDILTPFLLDDNNTER